MTWARGRWCVSGKRHVCFTASTGIMTLGMWIDYVIEWNNIHLTEKVLEKRRATQSNFDSF